MTRQAKTVIARGFVLAIAVFVLGFSGLGGGARAGCDGHVVLGGQAAQNEQKNSHLPLRPFKQKTCNGAECSKQSPAAPAIPVDGTKWLVEKASLGVVTEGFEPSGLVGFPRPQSDDSFPPGYPGGVLDPPRS